MHQVVANDFNNQRYITLNTTIPGQDRIYPKTHLCRTFFAEYTYATGIGLMLGLSLPIPEVRLCCLSRLGFILCVKKESLV